MNITPKTIKALDKASRVKCQVQVLANRSYLVVTPENHRYTVRMQIVDGLRYALCNCKAGAAGVACYHIIYAAARDDAAMAYGSPIAA